MAGWLSTVKSPAAKGMFIQNQDIMPLPYAVFAPPVGGRRVDLMNSPVSYVLARTGTRRWKLGASGQGPLASAFYAGQWTRV